MTAEDDDIWDSLWHGCARAAFLDEACRARGPPDPEATKRRAYRYYEEALAEKNRRASSPAPADPKLAITEEAAGQAPHRRRPTPAPLHGAEGRGQGYSSFRSEIS